MAGVQGADVVPLQAVHTFIEKNGTAVVRGSVSDNGVVGSVLLSPYLGVPEVHRAATLRQIAFGQDRVKGIFFIVEAITDGHALRLDIPKESIFVPLPLNSCVHQKMPPVRQLYCAAGKASGGVAGLVGGQGGRQPLPVDEVLCGQVSPVHGTPLVGIGVILVEQMAFPLIDGKSVGVVHPADGRGSVERGTLRRGNMGPILGFKISCLLQLCANHRTSSFDLI